MMQVFVCNTRGIPRNVIKKAAEALPPARRAAADSCRHPEAFLQKVLGFFLVQYALRQYEPDLPLCDWHVDVGGKPRPTCTLLQFNLSHTKGCIAVAVSKTHPVGIDIEKITPRPAGFAARWLSPEEQQAVKDAPNAAEALARIWTAKEAAAKLCGAGLAGKIAAIDTADTATIVLALGDARYALSLAPAQTPFVPILVDATDILP